MSDTSRPLCKGSTLKGKNSLQRGSKFFLLRVNTFSEGMLKRRFDRVVSLESVIIAFQV